MSKPQPKHRRVGPTWLHNNAMTLVVAAAILALLVFWGRSFFSEDAEAQPAPADSPPLEEPKR